MASLPTLDVRPDLRAGQEPLPRILAFVDSLPQGQAWRLLATFEPIPLLTLMAGRGYAGEARQITEGDWEVTFRPKADAPVRAARSGASEAPPPAATAPRQVLDNRGLTPPEPMIRVLEALEHLPAGGALEVWNDREPAFLYPELAARGWLHQSERFPDGVRILIWRPVPGEAQEEAETVLDVRSLPHGLRHDRIFSAVEGLNGSGSVVIVNDHDPKPLYDQLQALYGPTLRWTYLVAGPEEWRVRIGRASLP
jgi:uncharacterized protein (DUF2249 family)